MRSRTFRNVSLGILALAAAYHLGVSSATAQGAGVQGANILHDTMASGAANRMFWFMPVGGTPTVRPVPIPGTSPVVATAGQPEATAMLANGDIYRWNQSGWTFEGNLLGSATPAQRTSFGALKARYRGERERVTPSPASNR